MASNLTAPVPGPATDYRLWARAGPSAVLERAVSAASGPRPAQRGYHVASVR